MSILRNPHHERSAQKEANHRSGYQASHGVASGGEPGPATGCGRRCPGTGGTCRSLGPFLPSGQLMARVTERRKVASSLDTPVSARRPVDRAGPVDRSVYPPPPPPRLHRRCPGYVPCGRCLGDVRRPRCPDGP